MNIPEHPLGDQLRFLKLRQFCTSDIENFGDILYPLLFSHVAARSVPRIELEQVTFIGGGAPLGGGYETSAIRDLYRDGTPALPMVIGGGDLLRTDDEILASHYQPAPTFDRTQFIASRFPRGHGAFFRFPSRGPAISKVAFFSIGVPHRFTVAEYPLVRTAMAEAAYIYIRDEHSKSRLLEAGVQEEIIVAPDIAVILDDIFPRETLAETLDAVLSRHDLLPAAPYLCFQISAASAPEIPLIAPQLSYIAARHGLRVFLLPLAFCHGDREALSALAALEPRRFRLIQPRTIIEMLAIIAHAVVFCGVSMHGNIAAFVYKVRSMFGKLDASKIDGVMNLLGLPPDLHLQDWLDLRNGLEVTLARDRHDWEERHQAAKALAYSSSRMLIASLQK